MTMEHQTKELSPVDKLNTEFKSLRNTLVGEKDSERVESFIQARFSEEEQELPENKTILEELRKKVTKDEFLSKVQSIYKETMPRQIDVGLFDSRIQTELSEEEKDLPENKKVINELREKLVYYKELAEIQEVYEQKSLQDHIVSDFIYSEEQLNTNFESFVTDLFSQYSDRVKSGYFYKQLMKRLAETYKDDEGFYRKIKNEQGISKKNSVEEIKAGLQSWFDKNVHEAHRNENKPWNGELLG